MRWSSADSEASLGHASRPQWTTAHVRGWVSRRRWTITQVRGRESRAEVVKFGERIVYMPLKGAVARMHKGEPRQQEGFFLGLQHESGEVLVGTALGVVRAHSFVRVPEDQQWKPVQLGQFRGTPDKPVPTVEGDRIPIDIDSEGAINSEEAEEVYDNFGKGVRVEKTEVVDRETVVRQMKVTAQKVAKYGTTEACRGCEAYLTNKKGVPHNVDCRSRIREMMEKDERGRGELKHDAERVR